MDNNKINFLNNYINIVVGELAEKGISVTEEQKASIFNMFKDSELETIEIKSQIDQIVVDFVERYNRSQEVSQQKHYNLNELFDCRISGNTLHIHVVPKSVKDEIKNAGGMKEYIEIVDKKLDDALRQIGEILKDPENDNIENIYAVSPTLKLSILQELFAKKGFDVGFTDKEKFKEMFQTDKIGQAIMSKEKFFSLKLDEGKIGEGR